MIFYFKGSSAEGCEISMGRFYLFIIVVLILSACAGSGVDNGSEPENGTVEMTLRHVWQPENIIFGSVRIAMFDNQIIYMQRYPETINVIFNSIDGRTTRKVSMDRGKGPGEIFWPLNLDVNEYGIYICDTGNWCLSKFDLNGEFIDSFRLDKETGFIFNSAVKENTLVFNSLSYTLIGMIDMENGQVLHRIPGLDKQFPENNDPYVACAVACDADNGDIYTGWADQPYRIEVYDESLKKKRIIYKKIKFNMKDPHWGLSTSGGLESQGDFLIDSLAVDAKYIYAPSSSMSLSFDHGFTVEKISPSISVFDKKSGKYLYELTFEAFRNMKAMFSVIGSDREKIVVMINVFDGSLDGILKPDRKKISSMFSSLDKINQLFMVFDNPLY